MLASLTASSSTSSAWRCNTAHSAARRVNTARVHRCNATRKCIVRAAAATKDTPVVETITPAQSFRKYFTSLGWEKAWVDVVTDQLMKVSDPKPDEQRVGQIILMLKDLGIPTQSVCNMAAISVEILTVPINQAKTVVEYCKQRGITGAALVTLLEAHPKLLTYEVSGDQLAKGKTRAQVDVITVGSGAKKAVVSNWREGAAFESPVAPMKPLGL